MADLRETIMTAPSWSPASGGSRAGKVRRCSARLAAVALSGMALVAAPSAASPEPSAVADPEPSAAAEAEPASSSDRWVLSWHGYAFLDSNRQGGPSGARVFESVNHFMLNADRPLGDRWRMGLRGMFSLEPATVPVEGSPLLFQRGETYGGDLLVDRQHAHDLFVMLAAEWERTLGATGRLLFTAGLRAEPAVGPVAFPHRPSASEFPMAPLSHHNIDSTHISDDVVSALWGNRFVSVEGSLFHGEEPDENRWDLDPGSLDSYAGRVTLTPGGGFSLQVSACRREKPEALEEGNQTRQTGSVAWEKTFDGGGTLAVLAASGRNLLPDDLQEWGHVLEATWHPRPRHFLYGRIEQVDRDLYELINKTQRPEDVEPQRVHAEEATLGYAYSWPLLKEAETAAGVAVAGYRFDDRVDDVYGERPISLWVYLRFRFGSGGEHLHRH